MSHSVEITLIADQEIKIFGNVVNIHDIHSITVDSHGNIISYGKRTEPAVEAVAGAGFCAEMK